VFDAQERAVVKAHNGCSNLLADMLRGVLTAEDRVVLLFTGLDSFVPRVLEADQRRRWVHRFLQVARRAELGGEPWPRERLTEAQEAALLWAIHILDFQGALGGRPQAEVRVVSQQALQEDPAGTIRAAATFMELQLDERDTGERLEQILNVEAKTGRRFSLQDYREREAELQRRYRPQVTEAQRWLAEQPWGQSALSWPRSSSDRARQTSPMRPPAHGGPLERAHPSTSVRRG
jgi:hypothetical protein